MTTARTGQIEVTAALFLPPVSGRGLEIHVTGSGFVARAIPVAAKVGAQSVRSIALKPDGGGFSGLLERVPGDGDRLFVGYMDEALVETSVVFRPGGGTPVA
ncbi:MAG: hypothetical protein IPK82_40300 [Polyangiaceae bacterium]|nr:hypothetical protein [Polyangiaceae bacterium]